MCIRDSIQKVRSLALNIDDDLEVAIETAAGCVQINGKIIRLSPMEFAFFVFYAERALKESGPFKNYEDMGDSALKEIGDKYKNSQDFDHWSYRLSTFDAAEDAKKHSSSIRAKLAKAGFNKLEQARLTPNRGDLRINLPSEAISIA